MLNDTVREWVAKAEGDFAVASRELASAPQANHDAICYHPQQCIEN